MQSTFTQFRYYARTSFQAETLDGAEILENEQKTVVGKRIYAFRIFHTICIKKDVLS